MSTVREWRSRSAGWHDTPYFLDGKDIGIWLIVMADKP